MVISNRVRKGRVQLSRCSAVNDLRRHKSARPKASDVVFATSMALILMLHGSAAFVIRPAAHTPMLNHHIRDVHFSVADPISQRCSHRPLPTQSSLHAVPLLSTISTSALPLTYMFLLALQFAVQPVITKKFAPKTIIRSTYVLAQDAVRLLIVTALLTATQSWNVACQNWTYRAALATAGFPAMLYLVQSYCSLIAYQNLPPITFNVLNQTKTLSAAVSCFLLFGQRQSLQQVIALGIMLLAALVMEKIIKIPGLHSDIPPNGAAVSVAKDKAARQTYFISGILPILVASFVSGLAGAWTQRSLRNSVVTNSLLFTLQLSVFSMMLMGVTLLIPGASPDRDRVLTEGWSTGWTWSTWIPIVVNAIGGILVGLVTKFSGAVPKGFALIAGTFMSGILQNTFSSDVKVTSQQWVGGFLAAISVWMHSAYPYAAKVAL